MNNGKEGNTEAVLTKEGEAMKEREEGEEMGGFTMNFTARETSIRAKGLRRKILKLALKDATADA